MNDWIPIVRPHFPKLEGRLLSHLDRCLSEGIVTNNGPYVQDFEAVLTKFLRTQTICFASGQAALTTLLMAMDVGGGDVIVPSFTFPATPSAVVAAGALPVFADIDPVTLLLDPKDVSRKIRKGTRAILTVDVYGMSSVTPQLLNLSIKWNIPLLVDAAPSFGTHVLAKPNAALAPSIYSFHATKQLAVGEGGCLSSSSRDLLDRCKRIRNFGLDGERWREPGINGKMTEISALIGLENIKTFHERSLRRRYAKQRLDDFLYHINHVRIIPEPKGQTVSWLYCPVLIEDDASVSRDGMINLLADRGIQSRRHYVSCSPDSPVSNNVADRVIALPCHEALTDDEIKRIEDAFLDILGRKDV